MKYRHGSGRLDTAGKILKVNHAGEFGAINIYRSQILISRVFRRDYVGLLQSFLEDERRHLSVFWTEISRRGNSRCRSFWLCGLGGYALGAVSALLGRKGVMACTWAVESVVSSHLVEQLAYLESVGDRQAYDVVHSILEDERHHRDIGDAGGGRNPWLMPCRVVVSGFTEMVIRFGMR